jgi:hypothetical protein
MSTRLDHLIELASNGEDVVIPGTNVGFVSYAEWCDFQRTMGVSEDQLPTIDQYRAQLKAAHRTTFDR